MATNRNETPLAANHLALEGLACIHLRQNAFPGLPLKCKPLHRVESELPSTVHNPADFTKLGLQVRSRLTHTTSPLDPQGCCEVDRSMVREHDVDCGQHERAPLGHLRYEARMVARPLEA